MGWDKGSQAQDLKSQAVGSGSVVLQGDQDPVFRQKTLKWVLIGVTCQRFKKLSCIFRLQFVLVLNRMQYDLLEKLDDYDIF